MPQEVEVGCAENYERGKHEASGESVMGRIRLASEETAF